VHHRAGQKVVWGIGGGFFCLGSAGRANQDAVVRLLPPSRRSAGALGFASGGSANGVRFPPAMKAASVMLVAELEHGSAPDGPSCGFPKGTVPQPDHDSNGHATPQKR
jgi:hypothetical protein